MPAKGWKKEDAREHMIRIRLNDEELLKLERISKDKGTTYSELIRKFIEETYREADRGEAPILT